MQITLTFNSIAELAEWQRMVRIIDQQESPARQLPHPYPLLGDEENITALPWAGPRVPDALAYAGVETVGDLTALTADQLFTIDNIGHGSILEIQAALKACGLMLRSGDNMPSSKTKEPDHRKRNLRTLEPEVPHAPVVGPSAPPYDPEKATHVALVWDDEAQGYRAEVRKGPAPSSLPEPAADEIQADKPPPTEGNAP